MKAKTVWYAAGTAFEKILRRETLTISEHMQVDDSILFFISSSGNARAIQS